MSDGFFSRWSQRKQAVQRGEPPAELAEPQALPATPKEPASTVAPGAQSAHGLPGEPQSVPLPTIDDAQQLTADSDFQPFMRQGVSGEVRNLAMKKLFADPHFNVMDGLDIYIGDYTQPDPLPAGMLQKMVGAQFLKLVPPEEADPAKISPAEAISAANPLAAEVAKDPDQDQVATGASPVVAQSPDSAADPAAFDATMSAHDNPDLQLQPNHAPASPSTGPSTG